jgi:hypothetical protein
MALHGISLKVVLCGRLIMVTKTVLNFSFHIKMKLVGITPGKLALQQANI